MTYDQEEVDVSVSDSFLKPLFLDCVFHSLNDSVVRITCKIVHEAKSQNANALIFGRELLVPLRERSSLA